MSEDGNRIMFGGSEKEDKHILENSNNYKYIFNLYLFLINFIKLLQLKVVGMHYFYFMK